MELGCSEAIEKEMLYRKETNSLRRCTCKDINYYDKRKICLPSNRHLVNSKTSNSIQLRFDLSFCRFLTVASLAPSGVCQLVTCENASRTKWIQLRASWDRKIYSKHLHKSSEEYQAGWNEHTLCLQFSLTCVAETFNKYVFARVSYISCIGICMKIGAWVLCKLGFAYEIFRSSIQNLLKSYTNYISDKWYCITLCFYGIWKKLKSWNMHLFNKNVLKRYSV